MQHSRHSWHAQLGMARCSLVVVALLVVMRVSWRMLYVDLPAAVVSSVNTLSATLQANNLLAAIRSALFLLLTHDLTVNACTPYTRTASLLPCCDPCPLRPLPSTLSGFNSTGTEFQTDLVSALTGGRIVHAGHDTPPPSLEFKPQHPSMVEVDMLAAKAQQYVADDSPEKAQGKPQEPAP